jgi:hypothetical protein
MLLKVAGLLGPVGTPVAGKLPDVGVDSVLLGDLNTVKIQEEKNIKTNGLEQRSGCLDGSVQAYLLTDKYTYG